MSEMTFKDAKLDLLGTEDNLESLNSPLVQAFVALCTLYPPAAIVATAASGIYKSILERRHKEQRDTILKIIARGTETIRAEDVENIEFINAAELLLQAREKIKRNEKLTLAAKLFRGCLLSDKFSNFDEYEEWLNIIVSCSYRELWMLIKLYEYESEHVGVKGGRLTVIYSYWDGYYSDIKNKFGLADSEINSIMLRLQTTGFYRVGLATYKSGNPYAGSTTSYFRRFAEKLKTDGQFDLQ